MPSTISPRIHGREKDRDGGGGGGGGRRERYPNPIPPCITAPSASTRMPHHLRPTNPSRNPPGDIHRARSDASFPSLLSAYHLFVANTSSSMQKPNWMETPATKPLAQAIPAECFRHALRYRRSLPSLTTTLARPLQQQPALQLIHPKYLQGSSARKHRPRSELHRPSPPGKPPQSDAHPQRDQHAQPISSRLSMGYPARKKFTAAPPE